MRRRQPEAALQRTVVARLALLKLSDYLLAVPNGGARSKTEAAIMKGLGVRAGVADLFLALPRGGYAGLWIELKAPGTKLVARESQAEFLRIMRAAGYATLLANDIDKIMRVVQTYVRGDVLPTDLEVG